MKPCSNSRKQLQLRGSIWKRRPEDRTAVLAYLAMSYLYKRSNRFWYPLIRLRLTGRVWRPLIAWTRLRHLRFRQRLAASEPGCAGVAATVVSAGV